MPTSICSTTDNFVKEQLCTLGSESDCLATETTQEMERHHAIISLWPSWPLPSTCHLSEVFEM